MKSIFEEFVYQELLSRISALNEKSEQQWGKMQYEHLDHHLTQFGV